MFGNLHNKQAGIKLCHAVIAPPRRRGAKIDANAFGAITSAPKKEGRSRDSLAPGALGGVRRGKIRARTERRTELSRRKARGSRSPGLFTNRCLCRFCNWNGSRLWRGLSPTSRSRFMPLYLSVGGGISFAVASRTSKRPSNAIHPPMFVPTDDGSNVATRWFFTTPRRIPTASRLQIGSCVCHSNQDIFLRTICQRDFFYQVTFLRILWLTTAPSCVKFLIKRDKPRWARK